VDINLIYAAKARYGGWISYTVHLARALTQMGHVVRLYQTAGHTEGKLRPFAEEWAYQNLCQDDLLHAAASRPTIVTAIAPKAQDDLNVRLVRAGANLVLHDPNEHRDSLLAACRQTDRVVISIRLVNNDALLAKDVPSMYCRHPYVSPPVPRPRERTRPAVTLCRLDYDKHLELVCAANSRLPAERAIQMHGAENRLYTHHKLNPHFPLWRSWYHGPFPRETGAAVRLAASAEWVVDMSLIRGDGGGSQYTFLEAWDAGTPLIVQQGWLIQSSGWEELPCVPVMDAVELCNIVARPVDRDESSYAALVAAGTARLALHAPGQAVPRVLAAISKEIAV
jgi:hypothetical protein